MNNSPRQPLIPFLETLQQQIISAYGLPVEEHGPLPTSVGRTIAASIVPLDIEDRERKIDELVEEMRKRSAAISARLPSRFENPERFGILAVLADEIEASAKRLNRFDGQSVPVFASLRSGRVNALAVRVPDSDQFLVLFEDGLFGFANLMSKAVAAAFPRLDDKNGGWSFSAKDEDWRRHLREHPESIARMGDAILAYLVRGHPHAAQPYLLSPDYMNAAAVLRHAMELFVMGHEWGHILSGHLNVESTTVKRVAMEDAEILRLNYTQEFEADVRGLELALSAMLNKGYDLPMSFAGIDLFFSCIDVVERSVTLMRFGEARAFASETHPPTSMRREVLRNALKRSIESDLALSVISLADVYTSVVTEMFDRLSPVLLRLHRDAVQLAPGWELSD